MEVFILLSVSIFGLIFVGIIIFRLLNYQYSKEYKVDWELEEAREIESQFS